MPRLWSDSISVMERKFDLIMHYETPLSNPITADYTSSLTLAGSLRLFTDSFLTAHKQCHAVIAIHHYYYGILFFFEWEWNKKSRNHKILCPVKSNSQQVWQRLIEMQKDRDHWKQIQLLRHCNGTALLRKHRIMGRQCPILSLAWFTEPLLDIWDWQEHFRSTEIIK